MTGTSSSNRTKWALGLALVAMPACGQSVRPEVLDGAVSNAPRNSAVEVSVGPFSACAVRADGTVWCWGTTRDIRDPPTLVAARLEGLERVRHVAVGRVFSCAARDDGAVFCWGSRDYYAASSSGVWSPPEQVTSLSNIVQISVHEHVGCAVDRDGAVFCWGNTASGAIPGASGALALPTRISGLPAVQAVAADNNRSCAVSAAGAMYCWGNGSALGYPALPGLPEGAHGPAEGPHLSAPPVYFDSSGIHQCALSAAGVVECVGRNSYRQTDPNRGDELDTASFVRLELPMPARHLSVGFVSTTALLQDGHVVELGLTPLGLRSIPSVVLGVSDVVFVSTTQDVTCAVRADQSVWCWGSDEWGMLGGDNRNARFLAPRRIRGLP